MADLPLYLDVDGAYKAEHMSLPWADVLSEGVVPTTDFEALKVSALTPASMAVQLEKGACWIKNDHADAYERGGCWRAYFDAVQLPIDAADATNPRRDLVVVEVLDQQFGAASDLARPRVVKGSPASSPITPATPPNALALGDVLVEAAVTAIASGKIADVRKAASMPGRAELGLSAVPVGAIMAWMTHALPSGWLLCAGGAVPAEYPLLIAAIGGTLPDYRGRTLVGFDAAQGEFAIMSMLGGAKAVALAPGDMVPHIHGLGGHTHPFTTPVTTLTALVGAGSAEGVPRTTHTHTGNTGGPSGASDGLSANGAAAGHQNLQPYAVVNWIIKHD